MIAAVLICAGFAILCAIALFWPEEKSQAKRPVAPPQRTDEITPRAFTRRENQRAAVRQSLADIQRQRTERNHQ
jgi:hypothetical protein